MSFAKLKSACDGFRTLLREATGRELIDVVSLDEPKEPQDELTDPLISDDREQAIERAALRDGFGEACHQRG